MRLSGNTADGSRAIAGRMAGFERGDHASLAIAILFQGEAVPAHCCCVNTVRIGTVTMACLIQIIIKDSSYSDVYTLEIFILLFS